MKLTFLLLLLAFAGALSAQQQISVSMGSQVITDGQASVDLGDVPTSSPQSIEFTISNSGTAALTLNGTPDLVAIAAGANANASVTTQPGATVTAGGSTTFTVDFTAPASGNFDFNVSIANNAASGTFDFTVTGDAGTVAEISIFRDGALLMDGSIDLVGTVGSGNSVDLTYTIQNTGLIDLNLTGQVTVSAEVNCTVTVTQQPGLLVGPGGSATAIVQVTAASDAEFSFTLHFNNDTDNTSSDVNASGNVLLLHPGHDHKGRVTVHCSTGESSAEFLLVAAFFAAIALFIQRRRMA